MSYNPNQPSAWRWQYQENGAFYDFDAERSLQLEQQYIRQPYAILKMTMFGATFEFNFAAMTRTDVRRKTVDTIRRVSAESTAPSITRDIAVKRDVYVWHYNDNGYRKLDPTTSGKFERTFQKNQNAKFLIKMGSGGQYIVDFGAMTLTSYEDASVHQLLRLNMSENQNYVAPAALAKTKREIVPGLVKLAKGQVLLTPAQKKILKLLDDIPILPDFKAWTVHTPDEKSFAPDQALPDLPASAYTHEQDCPICFSGIYHPKTPENAHLFTEDPTPEECQATCFPCGHVYHKACAIESIKAKPACPSCRQPVGVVFGSQAQGKMTVTWSDEKISGFSHRGTITCHFDFEGGVTNNRHHQQGVHYSGDSRTCYFPATAQGFRALRWCALAFVHMTLFAVGYSGTRNCDNVIVYNLHLKTSTSGGEVGHGYPDKGYLKRFWDECKEQNVPLQGLIYDPALDDMDPRKAPRIDMASDGFGGMQFDSI